MRHSIRTRSPKAHMIDGIVFVHDPHFPGQRHLLVIAHQAVPQKMRQRRDQRLGAVRFSVPAVCQDDVQCIEQKVRVDLAAQLLQTAALHPVLQLQRLGLLAVQLPLDLRFFSWVFTCWAMGASFC